MSDEEDYGFEYSEDEEDTEDVEIENKYYEAKRSVESDPDLTLKEMDAVIEMEQEQGQWGFKALKQIVKILFRRGQYDEMLKRYKEMLTYVKSAVTRNYSEKKINSILEYVSQSQELSHLEKFYEMTLEVLKEARNERLWFNTKLKLGKLWFDMKVFGRGNAKLEKVLKELHKSCQKEDGSDDLKKGTQLLEIYALEIQMHTETKNTKKTEGTL
uniref:COP9 signalosome complex subunit 2 n=2 Tax=Rhodosorus marinus TaxID=101924 RepID=A0A7S3A4X1_9RHOD|mmetsp:Transcript_42880/g.167546  ORF Transcript_42880/g.167546 Transcript_42880/m.167546 type:complete len:214 (+) Transcript_42880:479-1120(+)